ncbi:MAG: hypothetical protein KDA44_21950, partial [Planctomycetales bacterium]|nr:hypothetical protein [Planctomycetales bacterium]
MDDSWLPTLLATAWLTPLASFAFILFFGKHAGPHGRFAGTVATGAIVFSCVLSVVALFGVWLPNHELPEAHHGGHATQEDHDHGDSADHGDEAAAARSANPFLLASADRTAPLTLTAAEGDHAGGGPAAAQDEAPNPPPEALYGVFYNLVQFGNLKLDIGYYIDALTVTMFCVVTLIASCVHFYAIGYMHDELHEPYTDHEVTLSDGTHLVRKGRFYRFFQYLSLFCFSMLGIVIAGNLAMAFVFWELVGICSYFLIGFYIERHSASTAANKAFIVNRVGDFGMLIGMMALWASLGTFAFGDLQNDKGEIVEPGVFTQLHTEENHYALHPTESMEIEGARIVGKGEDGEPNHAGHWLLLIAGVGIFCGCVGKSAQFPLHVWLPDAMEGPTPVSAMIHAATMVSAGVFLVVRMFPLFYVAGEAAPGALTFVAFIGAFTAIFASTIAVAQWDIKRVLAYSTISQLGFMIAALGVGAYVAALFHLITHAFFKALLFLGSGSVIHGVEHGLHHVHEHGHGSHGHDSEHEHESAHQEGAPGESHTTRLLIPRPDGALDPEDPQDMRNM